MTGLVRIVLAGLIAMALSLGAVQTASAAAADATGDLSVTVADVGTGQPLEGYNVQITSADGEFTQSTVTTANGNAGFFDVPEGDYDIYVESPDQEQNASASATVIAGELTIATVEIDVPAPPVPGISVRVQDATFGSAVEGAQVSLFDGANLADTTTSDENGEAFFDVAAGDDYSVSASAPGYLPLESPVSVTFEGSSAEVRVDLDADLRCEPDTTNASLTNMGFEDGLNGWTVGRENEPLVVSGADDYASPWEGASMLRMGQSQPDDVATQPQGPNVLCQKFRPTAATTDFSFNVFTYDYTGFDQFTFDVVVSDTSSGETLAAYEQGAWGEGTALKTSGWRGVSVDTSDYIGEAVTLTLRAGGTSDSLYAFWAYVDSAVTSPPQVNLDTQVTTDSGSVTVDPVTGQLTVAMPNGAPSDLTIQFPAACEEAELEPTEVRLQLDGEGFDATPVAGKDGIYTATIPAESIQSGVLTTQVVCPEAATLAIVIGEIVLYDPSGIISDAATGAPIVGAEVVLHKVPGWVPRTDDSVSGAGTCETNESKTPGAPWSQPAPTDLGEVVNAASPEISPHVNPFVTNNVGYYGWNVAEGCWYVTVSAEGYVDLTSPVVGVPSEVTDLDLRMVSSTSTACADAQAELAAASAAVQKATSTLNAEKAQLTQAQAKAKAAGAATAKAAKKVASSTKAVKKAKTAAKKAKAKKKLAKAKKALAAAKKRQAAANKAVSVEQGQVKAATTALSTKQAARSAAQAKVDEACAAD